MKTPKQQWQDKGAMKKYYRKAIEIIFTVGVLSLLYGGVIALVKYITPEDISNHQANIDFELSYKGHYKCGDQTRTFGEVIIEDNIECYINPLGFATFCILDYHSCND